MVNIGNQTYTSEKSVPTGKWAFLTLSYKNTETGCLLNASVADDANTTNLFVNGVTVRSLHGAESTAIYSGSAITTLVLGLLGLVCGAALALVAKRFAVPENPLVAKILAVLPGANCGGCGRPGCDGYARDIAENGAPLNLCTS